jgi:KDO2-lipid IV(A) lauroyltransferase
MLDEQWEGLGRSFAEFPQMDKLLPSTGRVEVINKERLVEIARGQARWCSSRATCRTGR